MNESQQKQCTGNRLTGFQMLELSNVEFKTNILALVKVVKDKMEKNWANVETRTKDPKEILEQDI